MTDTNATTLRNALAAAIKNHVTSNGLKAKDAAEAAGVQYSRLSQILRGDVAKISSDALVNVLGGFGYRLTAITGSGDGTEIVLSLDKAEGQVLPEIDKPVYSRDAGEECRSPCDPVSPYVADAQGLHDVDPDKNRVVADDE